MTTMMIPLHSMSRMRALTALIATTNGVDYKSKPLTQAILHISIAWWNVQRGIIALSIIIVHRCLAQNEPSNRQDTLVMCFSLT